MSIYNFPPVAQGDTLQAVFKCQYDDGTGMDLTGSTIRWTLAPSIDRSDVVYIGYPSIIGPGRALLNIPAGVLATAGVFYHALEVLLSSGESYTASCGNLVVEQTSAVAAPIAIPSMPAPHQVYLMGDSLTSPSGHYGTQLAVRLGSNWNVNWRGISGNTTTQMRARFSTDVIAPNNGEYIVIWGGVNDIAQGLGNGLSEATITATIKDNLQFMYTTAREAGFAVVAATITPFSGDAGWPSTGATARSIQDSVNAWVLNTATDVDYRVDTYAAMVDPAVPYTLQSAFDDGGHLHFTPLGYFAAANIIYSSVTWTPR